MNDMEKRTIRDSIDDVIIILDSAPIHRDFIADINNIRLSNRVPIAHLAIERGLKALITQACGNVEHIHCLNKLYRTLRALDQASASYLDRVFDDAVKFFRLNVNTRGFRHLRNLETYLNKVGTNKAFKALRYWMIEESQYDETPIPYIAPLLHRELLWGLRWLLGPHRRETVSERVERIVRGAIHKSTAMPYGLLINRSSQCEYWDVNWLLQEHCTIRDALEDAVHRQFVIPNDDGSFGERLREAYEELKKEADPAVQYYIGTLGYLKKGSQKPNPDAIPKVEWFNNAQVAGEIVTPAGEHLGNIEQYTDGAWGIIPAEAGPVRVTEFAENIADAKHYLVNRLTRLVIVTVSGGSRQLRIVSSSDDFDYRPQSMIDTQGNAASSSSPWIYDIVFWDYCHGLHIGDEVSIMLQPNEEGVWAEVLKGTVTNVRRAEVTVAGFCQLVVPSVKP